MTGCSIIIPLHNEADHLEEFFLEFWESLGIVRNSIREVHLMENGSSDDTYAACLNLERVFPGLIFAQRMSVASYGEAVKAGILSSTADAVSILECDALDAGFISGSLKIIEDQKADFVVGSKRLPESIDLRPPRRRMLTFLFNLWIKMFFRYPGTDTHGLKTARRDVAQHLCQLSVTSGEVFQTELVLLAYRLGYRVAEFPVHLRETRDTSVALLRRLPKVIGTVRDVRKSLARFPAKRS